MKGSFILDWERPKSGCLGCPFLGHRNTGWEIQYYCRASKKYVEGYAFEFHKKFLPDCPAIPAEEVESVLHGHWFGNTCSVCGKAWNENMVMNGDDTGYFDPMLAYCPNCGAKMDGEP